jgi:CHAD domain-containing protein
MTSASHAARERSAARPRDLRIEPAERVGRGGRRIIRAELAEAARIARDESRTVEDRVHEVRLCLKRARAVVALLVPAVGPRARRDNSVLREIARGLGPARDEVVARAALARLARPGGRRGTAGRAAPASALRRRLLRALSAVDAAASLRAAAGGLDRASRAVGRWQVAHGRRAARGGVERTYRRARRAYRRARAVDDAAWFHEWRKAVKRLGYQVAVLSTRAPGVQHGDDGPDRLKELARVLGDLHDLAVLRALVASEARDDGARAERDALLRLVDARARGLRHEARALGGPLFAKRPSAIGRRLEARWTGRHG